MPPAGRESLIFIPDPPRSPFDALMYILGVYGEILPR